MRRVACYTVTSILAANEKPQDALRALIGEVAAWLQAKGLPALPEQCATFQLRDGRQATVSVEQSSLRDDALWELTLTEPTSSGRFLTRACFATRSGRVHLFLELRAGGDGTLVVPVETDVRWPLVLRVLLRKRTWNAGHTPAQTMPIDWQGADGARRFLAVIRHKDRNLPVVAISQHGGQWLAPTLPEDLARDLCGLAIVAKLDEAASWAVTNSAGKEWSCFNGAVRLYWPTRETSGSAYEHPIAVAGGRGRLRALSLAFFLLLPWLRTWATESDETGQGTNGRPGTDCDRMACGGGGAGVLSFGAFWG